MIHTLELFPVLDGELISLLKSLSPDDWNRPTRAKLWKVKDVAAHLLDGNVRMLSLSRDQYFGEAVTVNSYAELVAYLNQLNADWIKATKRLSPPVLISLLEWSGKAYCDHLKQLDLASPAMFCVAWAGENQSPNWFHIAREYTEKWHHQQQIREAVNKPGITSRALYHPVLQTFLKAFPHHYRETHASSGSVIEVIIEGEAGGKWYFVFDGKKWFERDHTSDVITTIAMDQNDAWKLFTKGLSPDEVQKSLKIHGQKALATPFFSITSIMG